MYSLPQMARAGGTVQDEMMANCGTALLDRIQLAVVVKSQGGTDEAGDTWKPLHPRTIAKRLAKQHRTTSAHAAHPSQALTEKQREKWRAIFRGYLKRFPGELSSAARVAWGVLRKDGAHTLLDKYGTQKVDILRDTGELLESLTPNSGSNRAVFRVMPGQVELGSSRPHALAHHRGVPQQNLPQRRLWPIASRWPDPWWYDILSEAQVGVVELTMQVVTNIP